MGMETSEIESVSEWVWVYVEAAGSSRYGRVLRKHYEALISGNYTARFLTIEETFWLNGSQPVRADQRGVAPVFLGTFHTQVGFIATIAPVEDCTALFLPYFSSAGMGMSAWERNEAQQAVKKRRRKVVETVA